MTGPITPNGGSAASVGESSREDRSSSSKSEGLCSKMAAIFSKKQPLVRRDAVVRRDARGGREASGGGRGDRLGGLENAAEDLASSAAAFAVSAEKLRQTTEEASKAFIGINFFKSLCPQSKVAEKKAFFENREIPAEEEMEEREPSQLDIDKSSGLFEGLEERIKAIEKASQEFVKTSKKGNVESSCSCFSKFCQLVKDCLKAIKNFFIRVGVFFRDLFLKLVDAIKNESDKKKIVKLKSLQNKFEAVRTSMSSGVSVFKESLQESGLEGNSFLEESFQSLEGVCSEMEASFLALDQRVGMTKRTMVSALKDKGRLPKPLRNSLNEITKEVSEKLKVMESKLEELKGLEDELREILQQRN